MSDPAPDSALIVRMSSIGDVIHTLPAFMALRQAWPDAKLGWAVEPAAAPLLERVEEPLHLHVLDTHDWRRNGWRSSTRQRVRAAVAELRAVNYNVAIDFQGLLKSAVVARLSKAGHVVGLAAADRRESLAGRLYDALAPPTEPDTHVIERSLRLATAAGATASTIRFPRLSNEADAAAVEQQLSRMGVERFVVMHGTANWTSKRWPAARHAEVGRALYRRAGIHTIWVWGPSEAASARRIALIAGEGNHCAFATTLPQLAALLRRAALFVGGDSAPLHLAVACGTPTVAIFGPTDPAVLGSVHGPDAAVVNRLPCSFCHRRRCPIGTRECLEGLGSGEVVAAALDRLADGAARAG